MEVVTGVPKNIMRHDRISSFEFLFEIVREPGGGEQQDVVLEKVMAVCSRHQLPLMFQQHEKNFS